MRALLFDFRFLIVDFRLLRHSICSFALALLLLAGAWRAEGAAPTNVAPPMVPRATLRTNITAGLRQPGAKPGPAAPGAPQPGRPGAAPAPGGKTNALQAKAPGGTNAVSGGKLSQFKARLADTVARWRSSRAFYPVVGLIAAALAVLGFFTLRSGKKEQKAVELSSSSVLSKAPKRAGKQLSIHSCNILHVGPVDTHVWQFNAGFGLNKQQTT